MDSNVYTKKQILEVLSKRGYFIDLQTLEAFFQKWKIEAIFENEQGEEHTIRIVGIDEADASVGDVSWISPIARVFLKAHEGDTVALPTPSGVQHLEIVEVKYC